jgi:hypothetical protein
MELAAVYERAVTSAWGLQLAAAAAGEPALGPVAFPHRYASSADPLAPLGHHWQDSSHIAFGVVTAGWMTRTVKVEGSWFNGREPDEERTDFDFASLDSFSGRLWFAPGSAWAVQVSHGFLESPEALEPDLSVHRTTASAAWHRGSGRGRELAVTAVWGRNHTRETDTDAFLAEALLERGPHHVFGRLEHVEKTGHDLDLPGVEEHRSFDVAAVVAGYLHAFRAGGWVPAVGVRGSLHFLDEELETFYGSRNPAGAMVYVRWRPGEGREEAAGAPAHPHEHGR